MMTNRQKRYLLNFIYEEVEKHYYNAIHRRDEKRTNLYYGLMNEIKTKRIDSPILINIINILKENYKHNICDLPLFADNLLSGMYIEDSCVFIS